MSPIRFYLFKVEHTENTTPLDDLIKQIDKTPLPDRLRAVSHHDIRLEKINAKKIQNESCFLLDFVLLRFDNGPGKASKKNPIVGFNLLKEEGFAEETAALYIPSKKYLIVQYNHHGVKAGMMARYFSEYSHNVLDSYDLEVKLDEQAEARLTNKQFFRRLQVSIAIDRLTQSQRQEGISLGLALDSGDKFGATTVDIELKLERGQKGKLLKDSVQNAIRWIKRIHSFNEKSIISSEVAAGGGDGIDERVEIIDLIANRLKVELDDLMPGHDRRIPREERWKGLERVFHGWKHIIQRG